VRFRRYPAPKGFELPLDLLRSANRQSLRHNGRLHGAGAGPAYHFNAKRGRIEQSLKHRPSEGAECAIILPRDRDRPWRSTCHRPTKSMSGGDSRVRLTVIGYDRQHAFGLADHCRLDGMAVQDRLARSVSMFECAAATAVGGSRRRPVTSARAPFAAKASAVARPMLELLPVTMTTWFSYALMP